jgi:hypothetical protein
MLQLTKGLRRACHLRPRDIAVIDGARRFTWADFADRVARLAGALQALGLQRGDRVAILAQSRHEYIEYYFATLWAGVAEPDSRRCVTALSQAKAIAGRQGRPVGEAAVQLHGGMGMVEEYPAGVYLKRLIVIDHGFGSADHYLGAPRGCARPSLVPTDNPMPINHAYIVGAYEHPTWKAPDKSVTQLHAEVALGALKDAGLTRDDVDGYFCAGDAPGTGPLSMVDYLNLRVRHMDTTDTGGSAYLVHIAHAAEAIAAGKCNVALITMAGRPRSEGLAIGTSPRMVNANQPIDGIAVDMPVCVRFSATDGGPPVPTFARA